MDEVAATLRFLAVMAETQGRIIVELLRPTNGEIPDDTRRAIHGLLQPLSEAAIDVPESVSALVVFDHLVALFPPP